MAAWCSYDDQGDLTFGVDERAAEAMVGALPAQYLTAISRIHRKVLEISGFGSDEDSVSTAGQEEAIAGAEKN